MAQKKITKAERFEELKGYVQGNEELLAFLENEIAILKKKNENRQPTANQVENERLAGVLLEVLKNADGPMTIKEIIKANDEFAEFSSQKITPLIKKLGDKVVKEYDKKTATFRLAD